VTATRVWRHVLLGGGSIAAIAVAFALVSGTVLFRLSVSTGYAALALFAVTFALGPLYLLAMQRSPISTYLRRDVSIWGGGYALLHTAFGLQVHYGGRMWPYFVFEDWSSRFLPVRYDPFGIANYAGAAAAMLVLLLLAISNNAAMRKLGPPRWKAVQRSSYVVAALTLGHTFIYQVLEERSAPVWTAAWLVVAIVLALRLASLAAPRTAPMAAQDTSARGAGRIGRE
jgi:DMSO/TMAO reductase YedYZ heme-binding membrane subunit